jgi:hypothetical protein
MSRLKWTLYLAPDVLADLRQQSVDLDRHPGWLLEQAWRQYRKMPEPKRPDPPAVELPSPKPPPQPYLGRHRYAGPAHQTLGRKCASCGQFRVGASAECPGPPGDA